MNLIKAKFNFRGGVHPADKKGQTSECAIERLAPPTRLTISLAQHLGAPAEPCVAEGEHVGRYQRIATPKGVVSAPIHAPLAGKIVAFIDALTPAGKKEKAIVLEPDAEQPESPPPFAPLDWRTTAAETMRDRVRDAGIVGMGGAGFPTAVKLSPPIQKPIDTVIINGAECEPYLNGDNRLMIECAADIAAGAQIVRKILGASALRIAIETNKPRAIEAMRKAFAKVEGDVKLVLLKTGYPQGAEKQQIYSVTGRTVPAGGLPMDVRCVVENISTILAIYEAVALGLPLTRRVITVAGAAVSRGANFLAPIGTSFADLVAAAGGENGPVAKIISGGPMMGFAQPSLDIAMTKTSSGLLLFSPAEVKPYIGGACINCGHCVDACPLLLIPSEMGKAVEADDIDLAEHRRVMDCFECGCCSFVCPARRPLVQHFRRAKTIITARRRAAAGNKA